MWMNEYDIDDAARSVAHDDERPNLRTAVGILDRLVQWTNANSDGWPYWQAPSKAAAKLMDLVSVRAFGPNPSRGDIPDDRLKAALTPIRGFLTRQGKTPGRLTAGTRLWILEGDSDD